MAKISTAFIKTEVTHPNAGQTLIRDDELKGFGLRVTKNSISFIVEHRFKGRVCRQTIGKYGVMQLDEARETAQKILDGKFASKRDVESTIVKITLAEVLARFLEIRKLRPNTVRAYTQMTNRCLGDWFSLPATCITKEMVQARHTELTRATKQKSSGEVQANMAMRILRTLLNFAANNYETADGQSIIHSNPVKRLSQNRSWHVEPRRRVILQDHKLGDWYRAVMTLRQTNVRDYLLFLLLTGLRRNEAASLRWKDVDLKRKQSLFLPLQLRTNRSIVCPSLIFYSFFCVNENREQNLYFLEEAIEVI